MKTKIIWLVLALAVAGAIVLVSMKKNVRPAAATASLQTDGRQFIEVVAKEGYTPREITAKAGVPLTLKMKTQDNFNCTSAFTIPSLGLRMNLPPTGETAIEIPAQKTGETLRGVCGMGMYSFTITFT